MKALVVIPLLAFSLLPPRCQHAPPAPPPANVPSAAPLDAAADEQDSKAAAAVFAAKQANEQNPPGAPREAVAGELSVAQANLPAPSDKDRAEALERSRLALEGKLADAEQRWASARDAAAALRSEVAELKAQVQRERTAAAAELARQLAEARDQARAEADAKERLLLMAIFFGFGALCLVGAVLVGQLGVAIPMFGPRAAVGLGLAGGLLIGVGILVRFVDRLMERHPMLFWGGILAAVLAVVAAAVLMYANHRHAKPA